MRSFLVAILVAVFAPVASADPEVSGFVTLGTGELSGQVSTLDGKPLKRATVHIVTASAKEMLVTTDAAGRYRATLDGGDVAYVYVEGKAKIGGQTVSSIKEGEGEAIAIREAVPPSVPAKLESSAWKVPEYSELAEDRNMWARAWLLLHVSATGQVLRVKLINKPGLDLDAIAVREAFGLVFEPARDRMNRGIRSMVLWTFEWPAYYWMVDHQRAIGQMPPDIVYMQCGKNLHSQRECSMPNIANAIKLPWIERPRSGR